MLLAVSTAPPPGQPVCRLQLPGVRQAPHEGCLPGKQECRRSAAGTGAGAEGSEGFANAQGALLPSACARMYSAERPADGGIRSAQRQTVISQFYQINRLVVEGGISVCRAVRGLRERTSYFGQSQLLTLRRARTRRVTVRRSGKKIPGEQHNAVLRARFWRVVVWTRR